MKREIVGLLAVVCSLHTRAHAGVGDEIGIGRTSGNVLVAEVPNHAVPMPRSIFAGIPGYASSLIGFENVIIDDPAGADGAGVFRLSPSSSISVLITHVDAGLQMRNDLVLLTAGGTIDFGPPAFDVHPIYNIADLGVGHGQEFAMRFVLHDSTATYADSAELELRVTPACPGDYDLSDTLEVLDIFEFLGGWFDGLLTADFDRSGTLEVGDIFGFLNGWFAGCD